ncbi:hypothetical protein DFR49_3708 [Hephaestia caeni]|uniref:Uncharacterized protein n=1 Tax=Hephaestia caeni TaxID=645617 RepID=A0A397NJW0_9SPHN|nr:hypothetical protein [Hephaestia caeni]RIA37820.1 hypothetical protein DFR49_3708 [Hephaestia caeni]
MGKKNKARLPKQVAGVKIPKKLRKKGGKLLAALDTPLGREVALAGLMTAAAAIARRKSAAASPSGAADSAAGPEAASAAADEPPHRDPHAAGAQFASAAAGIATAALDRWLKNKRADPPTASKEPPAGGTTH